MAHATDSHLDLGGNSDGELSIWLDRFFRLMRMHRYARVTVRHRQIDLNRLNRWLEQQGIELSDNFSEVAVRSLQETDPPARSRTRISLNH